MLEFYKGVTDTVPYYNGHKTQSSYFVQNPDVLFGDKDSEHCGERAALIKIFDSKNAPKIWKLSSAITEDMRIIAKNGDLRMEAFAMNMRHYV
eukprot:UN29502